MTSFGVLFVPIRLHFQHFLLIKAYAKNFLSCRKRRERLFSSFLLEAAPFERYHGSTGGPLAYGPAHTRISSNIKRAITALPLAYFDSGGSAHSDDCATYASSMLHNVAATLAIDPRGATLSPDISPLLKPVSMSQSGFTAGSIRNIGVVDVTGAGDDDGWSANSILAPAYHGASKHNGECEPSTSKLQQYEMELASQLARAYELGTTLDREQQLARVQLDAQRREVA